MERKTERLEAKMVPAGRASAESAFERVLATLPSLMALLLLCCQAPQVCSADTQDISESAKAQIGVLLSEKALRTPSQQKIESRLLLEAKRRRGDELFRKIPGFSLGQLDENVNGVLVEIRSSDLGVTEHAIEARGGRTVATFPRVDLVIARVPLDQIERLAEHDATLRIRSVYPPILNKINVSEGDFAHGADLARTRFGVDGSGVTVGVISDSVEDLSALQASGDLPLNVTVLPGQGGVGTSEGTAMMEIVYDLAPSADLVFAAAGSSEAQMAQNILALADIGCDVIVDDIHFPAAPVFQDGIIAQAVETVVAAGVLFFSSAGNSGNLTNMTSGVWEGDFVDSGVWVDWIGTTSGDSAGYLHDFGGVQTNVLTAEAPGLITLQWSDSWLDSSNDYDFCLLDDTGSSVIYCSNDFQSGPGFSPIEVIPGPVSQGFQLAVINFDGDAEARYLHINTHRGRLTLNTSGQVWGHPAADGAFAVAAVDVATAGGGLFVGGSTNPVEDFSSDGPRRVFFHGDGTPITPSNFLSSGGVVRQKPDMTAADGVSTASSGFNTFFGTSAAAPHAAALAALMKDLDPSLSPGVARQIFEQTALDIEAPGFDRDSGHGIIMAEALLESLEPGCSYSISPSSASFAATGGDGTVTVNTAAGCAWTATTYSTWMTITSGSSGSGAGSVSYNVAQNTSIDPRTGTLTIAGRTFTVTQSGTGQVADFTISNDGPDIGETVTFTAAPGIQPVSWNFGGQDCDGQNPQIDCASVPGDCRTMQWTWAEAGTKEVTMATASAGSKTRDVGVNDAGSCPTGCDATGPPVASFSMLPNPALVDQTVTFIDTSTGSGPNAPTDWLWTIKKGGSVVLSRSIRTFSSGFEAGDYQVELMASNCGYSDSESAILRVLAGPAGEAVWLVPTVVHTPGLNQTLWKTDLRIFNPGDQGAEVTIDYLPENSNNTQIGIQTISFVLGPKQTSAFDDVALAFPGNHGDSTKGSLRMTFGEGTEGTPVLMSRTYNDTPGGTFGQYVPGVAAANPSGQFLYLTGLSENDSFRTNIGLVNLESQLANDLAFTLYDEQGNQIGETFTRDVLPFSSTQIVRVARVAGISDDLDTFSLRISPDGARVVAYASVVDNVTGDPVYLEPGIENAHICSIPGLAHLPGLHGSTWRSDITYFNPGSQQLEAVFRYYPDDYSGWVSARPISLSPKEAISMTDVIGSISHPGGENSKGHIVVSGQGADSAPLISARTYNLAPTAGTFGQNVQVFDGSRVIEEGQSGYMPGVCNSADGLTGSRTNIGIANSSTGGMFAVVLVTFWTETGTIVASSQRVDLAANEMYQSNLFDLMELGDHDLCGTARVKVEAGGPVAAYASIIDNRTQDPIMVPALKAR